jgi:hypothetical protein
LVRTTDEQEEGDITMFQNTMNIAQRRALMQDNLELALENARSDFAIGGRGYSRRYGARYNVGAQWESSTPQIAPNIRARTGAGGGDPCNPNWADSPGTDAGHGRRTTPVPGQLCKPAPPKCDCHVIAVNSLRSAGIASGAFGNLTIGSGDASFFIPYYIAIVAFEVNTTTSNLIINPGTPLMALMVDSTSGREPNMRRGSNNDERQGVWTLIYGFEKEIECVDWRPFAEQAGQNLTLRFFNPNTVGIHVFVNLWGIAGVPALGVS